jgi:3-oxoacyl-[acyl-carrier protein] reductase
MAASAAGDRDRREAVDPHRRRAALVTGGNRGIGRAVGVRLAARGYVVALHYGHDDTAAGDAVKAAAEAGAPAGGEAFALRCDLGRRDGPAELFRALDGELRARTGSTGLDVLVNNAAISPRATIADTTVELFDDVFAVNVRAPFFVLKEALPRLRDGARVVNISSTVTRIAYPDVVAYSMSKGAVEIMARTLAADLGARGITINTVTPGVTDTDMNASWLRDSPSARAAVAEASAMGRVAEAGDVADAVALLTLPEAGWITGTLVDASGGADL